MFIPNSYDNNIGPTFTINDTEKERQVGGTSQNQLGDVSDSSSGPVKSCSQLESIENSDSYSSDSGDEANSTCANSSYRQVSFRLGQQFSSIDEFYEAVKGYGVYNGYVLSFVRKDNERCRVKCVDGCPWLIYCSKIGHLETYEVKTYYEEHNCKKGDMKGRFIDTKWLSKNVAEDLKKFPNMTGLELQTHIAEKLKLKISKSKAYRIRNLTLQSMDGDQDDQYAKLWDYREELLRTNPGTTFEILAPGEPPRFERLYICIDACKKGFLAGCRPLIAIDGCFLTGYHGGQLLSAVAQDGNNGLFPIAFAIVFSETKDAWSWFLQNLLKDIGYASPRGEKWTFISDQGPGLISALKDVYPSQYHRNCVVHVFRNFKKKWRDRKTGNLFWAAVNATTFVDYEIHMNQMQHTCVEAWKYLTNSGMESWSRAGFESHVKNTAITSNSAESFNSQILEYRGGGITSLIENIRAQRMKKMYEKGEKMRKRNCLICPNVLQKLNISIMDSKIWTAVPCGDRHRAIFEVSRRPEKFVVNLEKHTCTCRKWDISGIPCKHAVAAVDKIHGKHEDYVSAYFTKETFLKIYDYCIYPVASSHFWPKSDHEPILQPLYTRPVGRPKRQRGKDPAEKARDPHKAKRKYGPTKCSRCGGLGHNKRSCKAPRIEKEGSSRENVVASNWSPSRDTTSQPNCMSFNGEHVIPPHWSPSFLFEM